MSGLKLISQDCLDITLIMTMVILLKHEKIRSNYTVEIILSYDNNYPYSTLEMVEKNTFPFSSDILVV